MKVSIITPTYNCGNYIRKTLTSILEQSFKDFEVLVIDDCSSDDTVKVIREFKDPRIKLLINDTNNGAAFCRNRALKEAKGEYIAFLDGDDLWLPNKLEKQISFMESNNYAFSFTNYELIDKDNNKIGIRMTGPNVVTHKIMMKVCYLGCLTVMFKKDIYPDLSIPDTIYKRNDYALWLKLSERTNCYLLNETLSLYRQNNGISSGKKASLIKHHRIMFQTLYGFNRVHSWLLAMRNVFYYFWKQLKYKKRLSK